MQENKMEQKLIAVIRIHGKTSLKKGIKDTMNMLRLYKKHTCVLVPNTKDNIGMITKIKEYVTWGEVSEPTLKKLLEKRGRLALKESLTHDYVKAQLKITLDDFAKELFTLKKAIKDLPGLKTFFKLSPPRGGFERGGIKTQFASGGAVGYRKEKINELVERML